MVYVVLRSGKVIQYNTGNAVSVEDGTITVRDRNKFLIARVPMEVVERAEFQQPCAIRRAKAMPKKADY